MATFESGGAALSDPSALLNLPSPADMRLRLQNLLDLKEKQLQHAGTLGQRVLAQQMELEERIRQLQELEADRPDEDNLDADMREKYRELAETIKGWDDENAQLSSAFGSQRLVNGTAHPSPPYETTELPRDDPDRSTTSAGQSAAQSRRARNAAHRQDDVEFAFEIGSGLLTEVRRLQSLLGERDKAIQDMKEEKDDLERTVENLRTALRQQEQSAEKYKEENWNLEVTLQEIRAQFTESQGNVQRLEGEHKRVTKQLNVSRETAEQHKSEAERQKVAYEELKAKHETDIAHARKNQAGLQREKADLQQTIENMKSEAARAARKLPRFGSPLTPNGVDKSQLVTPSVKDEDGDVFGTTGGASTRNQKKLDNSGMFGDSLGVDFDDESPDPSPSRPFLAPNHPSNEMEALQQRLAHAQRQINTLKNSLQREKEVRIGYRRRLEASGATVEDDEELGEEVVNEDAANVSKPKLKSTPYRSSARGRGRGRGRGGLTLAQRLGMAAKNPSSDVEDEEEDFMDDGPSPPPVPAIPAKFQLNHVEEEYVSEDETSPVRGPTSPSPSNRVSVDGMDPMFANVLRRSSSAGSLPNQSSPLRQVVGKARGGTLGRRARGGAAYQGTRPPSLVGEPEALAAELGLGPAVPENEVLQEATVETAEFGVQTEDMPEVRPEPLPEPQVPAPVLVVKPEVAEMGIQAEPEPVPESEPVAVVERHETAMQTDAEPVVAVASRPTLVQAEVQASVEKADADAQTPPPRSPVYVNGDTQTVFSALDKRSSVFSQESSGDSTIRGQMLSRIVTSRNALEDDDDAATETGVETDTDAEMYEDARQSIVMTTPSQTNEDFQSIYTVTDNDYPDTDDDDLESIKASRLPSRQGPSTAASSAQQLPSASALSYESVGVSAEAPEPPKPEMKETSIQTDEWVPPAPVPAPVSVPLVRATVSAATSPIRAVATLPASPIVATSSSGSGHVPSSPPSIYRVGQTVSQQFHFISPPPSAGPTTTTMPVSPPPAPGTPSMRDVNNIPRPRTSQSDRRQSIELILDEAPARSRAPSAVGSPAVDKSRPPMMMLPPPPRQPPPPNSMPPPSFIPERRAATSTGSRDIPPPRPTSPPPPELIQRATTPTLGAGLAVPGRGAYGPRPHGSSLPPLQQALGQRPSTTSFRSAANAINHSQQSSMPSPSALASFGRREMSTTSLLSDRSMGSARSSMSSDHFLDRQQMQSTSLTPGRIGAGDVTIRSGGSTDPAVIHAITQTMIGEFLYKYTRRAIGKGYGERRHRRFFWVHPYTRTLYWSSADPTSSNVTESSAKSAYVEGVRSILDPNPIPPGLYQYSVIISTPNREMKITAPTKERHDVWFNALKYLLSRPNSMTIASPANMPNGGPAPLSPMSGQTDLPGSDHQNPLLGSPQSHRSARSGRTEASGESWNHTPRGRRSHSQLSGRGSISKRSGTPAAEYLRWAGSSEEPHSPSKSFEHIPGQDDDELDFELHDDTMSDGGFEGLENVRACCDGRHTVGRSGKDHHHHHHHHDHPPNHLDINPAEVDRPVSPAWSFRSRRSSSQSRDTKSRFTWGREDGRLRFGSRRSTRTAASAVPVSNAAQEQ